MSVQSLEVKENQITELQESGEEKYMYSLLGIKIGALLKKSYFVVINLFNLMVAFIN